jgi:hypothetical protein
MANLASLHGAGYRLVLREPRENGERNLEADFFGPDGIANDVDAPLLLDLVETGAGNHLRINENVAEQIGRMILEMSPPDERNRSVREVLRTSPVRTYERAMAAAPPVDPETLERLGRLGEALLVSYGFAPPPPVPTLMKDMPSAYTYLGQFLAHEMTLWDPADASGPPQTVDLIDSAIDLKTIFKRPLGFPRNLPTHVQEEEGLPLNQTIVDSGPGFPGSGLDDLPRMDSGRALILDPRNDQNLTLSQTQVAITRFAQAAISILKPLVLTGEEVRRIVLRHFQSVVLQDYLVRLVDPKTYDDVMVNGRVWVAPSAGGGMPDPFYVSPEFSGAIFRFGHAMRRDNYSPWNTVNPNKTVMSALASDLLDFSFDGGDLTNGQLLQTWTTDWRHMLGTEGVTSIKATSIGTAWKDALFCLPGYLFQPSVHDKPCNGAQSGRLNLARRTLISGGLMGLPSGQVLAGDVQTALVNAGSPCQIPILSAAELDIPDNPAATAIMQEGPVGSRFVDHTPLWIYILLEAAVKSDGDRLGPLGGRIVAETLSAAIEASGSGMIVNGVLQPFTPDPAFGGKSTDKFVYSDLVRLAFSGNP